MTCEQVREQLSAHLDDAPASAARAELEGHLAGCAACRRELDRLRATVGLVAGLGPVHAPAGFVDRVVEAAYRRPWSRRLRDALLLPWRTKVPLEAAALLLVALGAVHLFERTPEVQERAAGRAGAVRVPEAPAVRAPSPGPPPPSDASPAASSRLERPAPAPPVLPGATREPPASRRTEPAAPAPEGRPRPAEESTSVAPGRAGEVMDERRGEAGRVEGPAPAPSRASPLGAPLAATPGAESGGGPRAWSSGDREKPSAKVTAPPAAEVAPRHEPGPADRTVAKRSAAPSSASAVGPAGAAGASAPSGEVAAGPASPAPAPGGRAASEPPAGAPAGATAMRAMDASGRLAVTSPEAAEREVRALAVRVGATSVSRRVQGAADLIALELVVPRDRYPELVAGLRALGRWIPEYEAPGLPVTVRIEVALVREP